jgi:hypothetical protein
MYVMKISQYIQPMLFAGILLAGCKEKLTGPQDDGSGAPGPVSQVQVERLPGAVRLQYSLPGDKNLQHVKAVTEINGQLREVKASAYHRVLEIAGFGDTTEHEVKIYAVSRSEKLSNPVIVKVKPLEPPVMSVYSSLTIKEDFGGATVQFNNAAEADISVVMLTKNAAGDWVDEDVLYTKRKNGYFSVRGFDTIPRVFGAYIRDRWNNRSDTLMRELKPIYEKQLDRTKFFEYYLPTDEKAAWSWWMPYIWDGVIVNNTNVDKPGFHTAPGRWPQWFTFSLGVNARLSRFRFWQRGSWVAFTDRNIKKFELWGSNDPAKDGSWTGWTLLLEGESVKPSGLPMGTNSPEDLALVGAGEEFVFPPGTPAMKYIRMKVLETWGNNDSFYIMQVAFWGTDL